MFGSDFIIIFIYP